MAKLSPRRQRSRGSDDTDVFPVLSETDDGGDGEVHQPLNEPDEPDEPAPAARRSDWSARASRFGRAVLDRLPQISVAIVGGILLCLSFPPFGWWYAAVAALALLAWVLTRESTKLVGGFGYGFLFGLAFYVLLLPWTGEMVGPVPWLALSTVQAVFPGLFGLAAVAVRRLPGWPIWFAALWVGLEWLKSTVPFGGFPWGVVGFSQTGGPLLSIAQLGGAPLVSFAVALAGCSVTALVVEVVQWWRHSDSADSAARPAVVLPGVCICVVLLTTALVWPNVRQSGVGAGQDRVVTVAAVQGNVPRLGLDFNAQRREVLDNHVEQTLQLAEDVRAGRAPQPMFVIWPENSSDIDPLANADAAEQINVAANAIDAPILVGTVLAGPGDSPDNPVSTNSVLVWEPGQGPTGRHDKQIVQPFGEYLPLRSVFRHLSPYADRAGHFVPGDGSGVVYPAGVPVGIATCWEVIFDRAARESVLNGAQMLAVPSNNATFNEAMSKQQLAFGKLRAVEHNRYVVVAGTTGISAVITPDGREVARTEFFEAGYLDTAVRLKTQLTPATQWGPIVHAVLVLIGVAAVGVAILHNRNLVRRRPSHTQQGAT